MNFLQAVAAYVAGRFTFNFLNRHGVSVLRVIGAIAVVILVIGWLYSK